MAEARYVARIGDMLVTAGGKLVVDTAAAWAELGMKHDGLLRVPATTHGVRVSMLSSPACRTVRWWEIEDAAS